jgi:hypothetical protein
MTRRSPRAVTPLAHTMTERQWQATVEGLLRFYGWRYHHAPDNKPRAGAEGRAGRQRVGDRGFPDLVAVRHLDGQGPELAFLELKTETGRLGDGQDEWLEALRSFADEVADLADEPGRERPDLPAPRVIVGVYRPAQRRALEDLLAGPDGRNVLVGTLD